jgi:hypothetical protein
MSDLHEESESEMYVILNEKIMMHVPVQTWHCYMEEIILAAK